MQKRYIINIQFDNFIIISVLIIWPKWSNDDTLELLLERTQKSKMYFNVFI